MQRKTAASEDAAVQTVEKPLFCVKQDRGSLHIEG